MDSSSQNNETFVAKLNANNKPLYLKILWVDDSSDLFHIKLFFEDASWTGIYTKESAAIRLNRLDETEKEYYCNIKEFLKGNSKDYVLDFSVTSDDINLANFTWKKRYGGALKAHGVVPMQRDKVIVPKEILIDFLLDQNKNLASDIEVANKTNVDLKEDLETYTQKFDELIKSKANMETTLYAHFVQVLNEKKRRIQLLKDHLKNYEQST